MIDKNAFTARLKFLRERNGWSQRETSLALGFTATSYRDIELNIKKVSIDDLVALAELFGVPEEWLLHGRQENLKADVKKDIEAHLEKLKSQLTQMSL